MATITLTCIDGTRTRQDRKGVAKGEALTVDVAVVTSTGTAVDLSGKTIVLGVDTLPSVGLPASYTATGTSTGTATFSFTGNETEAWAGQMQYDLWIVTGTGTSNEQLVAPSPIILSARVADPNPSRVYYGVATTSLSGQTATEAALSYSDVVLADFTFTFTSSDQKIYYAFPAIWGQSTATKSGNSYSELAPRYVTLTDAEGSDAAYALHESTSTYTEASTVTVAVHLLPAYLTGASP